CCTNRASTKSTNAARITKIISKMPTSVPSAQPAIKGPDVLHQGLWLLQGGKMPARGHGRPALQVAHPRRPLPWWADDLARERRHGRRYRNALATPQAPRPMAHLIVEPERAIDCLRHPVQHNVREQGIFTHPTLDVAVAIRPGIKLFDDPGGQPGWRIVQGVRQRLRPSALDPLITCFLGTPGVRLGNKRLFSR